MRNFYLYLSIMLAAKVAILVVVGMIRKRRRKEDLKSRAPEGQPDFEQFLCVKTELKKVNDTFFVSQIVFANQSGCSLITLGEARRRSSD